MCCSWAGPQGLWGGTVDPGGRWEQTRDGAGSSREVPGCCWRSSRLSTQQVRCAWGILRCFVLGLNPYLPKSLSWARLRLIPRVVCPLPAALFQTDMQARFWGQLEGFRSPSPHTRSWFPHLPAPSSPNPHCPFFSPSPGVGRAAGQGGGGVGRAVRVGARPPPADEVRGAEPLHPLGQVRAPPGAPGSWLPALGAAVGAGSSCLWPGEQWFLQRGVPPTPQAPFAGTAPWWTWCARGTASSSTSPSRTPASATPAAPPSAAAPSAATTPR